MPNQRPEPSPHAISYGIDDAARITGLSRSSLYRAAARGEIRLTKAGCRTLIPAADLKRLVGAEPTQ